MSKKVFVTDVDGVLFNWQQGFFNWLNKYYDKRPRSEGSDSYYLEEWFDDLSHNDVIRFVEAFNQSKHAYDLPLIPHAKEALEFLSNEYDIFALTAFSACKDGAGWRTEHLEQEFGKSIKGVIVLPLGSSKKDALAALRPDVFIDDHVRYIEEANELGIDTIIMDYRHNRHIEGRRISSWKELIK